MSRWPLVKLALAAYFYTIATILRGEGRRLRNTIPKVKDAIFSCVAEDVPAVFRACDSGPRGAVRKNPCGRPREKYCIDGVGGTVHPDIETN